MKAEKAKKEKSLAAQTASHIISYAGCIAISLIVMYYFSGAVGILLAVALGCAFVFSLALTLLVMRSVRIEAELDKPAASKGECVVCRLRLRKSVMLPAPIIELHIGCTNQLEKDVDICRASLAGSEVNTLCVELTAKHCGAAEVFVREAFIVDYLGIMRFRLKDCVKGGRMKLAVYPDIPDAPIQTDFLKTAALFSQSDDDEEETNETSMNQTGMPGYDHREYFPGDPLKRINWKMSSKRGVYMVRLDEKLAGAGQVFFLDDPPQDGSEKSLSVRDCVIEGMLAVFAMLIKEGREAVLFFNENKNWLRADIRTGADLAELQSLLATLSPREAGETIPPGVDALGKTPICFTAATAEYPHSAVSIADARPDALMVCSQAAGLESLVPQMWLISPEFELTKAE